MKYSLRSLMIVVTLVCVLLASFMARANHLKRWADYHDREAERMVESSTEHGLTREMVTEEAKERHVTTSPFWHIAKHRQLANEYREAMYRPWVIVEEYFIRGFEPPNSSASAPNPPKP